MSDIAPCGDVAHGRNAEVGPERCSQLLLRANNAVTGAARSPFLPNVSCFAELGHDEFTASVWFGLMARVGTPRAAVERLLNAAKAAHADPAVKAKFEAQGLEMSGQSGPEFESDIRAQAERWARLITAAGFKAD